ncbi:DUF1062 domain-containing protein [Citrobacter sedlakii]|uniref:DUF1062 domain-containing protein n=1 Tax=Citrobacter sedlakii TaxID=67826 RepID=A0ABS0ZSW7_9ENTR|nr:MULTISPECIES: DUF1062 domain-containing protein [Citrobacter]MBJ8381905.1 DUF1062 domain-containing protein [Citrobacter sedlakii]MBM9567399.1 DUF1062 domain-containing protein [Citrobacter sedlakii]HBL4691662.1 DUF1062 domain-containing protein [Citrobacter sedlakii]HBL4705056.1 DUF1062 domain-containing protein [Citrobacter sedlakii]HBL4718743.1 DUF1062 domain-containing protein [Citrobacter sedlakii]
MKVTWTVTPVGHQRIAKRCPSCNIKREFTPAGAFRINSQKKRLDVWSIYKCTHCECTWNIALFSRLNVNKLDPELYRRFLLNDADTVENFAHNKAILKRNNARPSGKPDFHIQEQWPVSIFPRQWVSVCIRIPRAFQVNLLAILKKQLMLSSAEIYKRVDSGEISGVTKKMLKSRKGALAVYHIHMPLETVYARRRIDLTRR